MWCIVVLDSMIQPEFTRKNGGKKGKFCESIGNFLPLFEERQDL